MSIFVNKNTKVVVQGITGRDGAFHSRQMIQYGTQVVAGVTPGKGGLNVEGVPVFNTVAAAKAGTQANTSIIFVPAVMAADAMFEAIDAGLDLIVCISEGVPANDMLKIVRYLQGKKTRIIGPNCPGLISPGEAKVGILPGGIFKKGSVGVVSRSGTLTYEIVSHITAAGLGESTCVGIGGDPIIGTNFIDCLEGFNRDPETKAIALVGEIGGTDEEDASRYIIQHVKKPVVSFIAGRTAPPGKRMGHAGAIIAGGTGTAEEKIKAFEAANVPVCFEPAAVANKLKEVLA
jgi:succinyl-CoA synthetase alpha subunit